MREGESGGGGANRVAFNIRPCKNGVGGGDEAIDYLDKGMQNITKVLSREIAIWSSQTASKFYSPLTVLAPVVALRIAHAPSTCFHKLVSSILWQVSVSFVIC